MWVAMEEDLPQEFDAPLTGDRIRLVADPSTPSGVNWEYVDQ